MQNEGIQPTQWTYTAKAKVESSIGAFEDALRTTEQMRAAGLPPVQATWQIILSMAQQKGRDDVVRQVGGLHAFGYTVLLCGCWVISFALKF